MPAQQTTATILEDIEIIRLQISYRLATMVNNRNINLHQIRRDFNDVGPRRRRLLTERLHRQQQDQCS